MSGAAAPRIAVIIPNYNDAQYLPRCLGSVLDQPVPPDELIVIDDCSSDDSVGVMRRLLADCPYATVIENASNLGVYRAVDEGLKRSRSEYALFLAANDWILPGLFERAKRGLAEMPGAGLWSAMAWLVDEDDRPIRLHHSPVVSLRERGFDARTCIRLAHRFGGWFAGTTIVYRRSALDEMGGFDPALKGLSDLVTALMVAARHGAAYAPAPLATIRMHRDSHLSRTLSDPAGIAAILERLEADGPRRAPELFDRAFRARTRRRLVFASLRATRGLVHAEIAALAAPPLDERLARLDRLLPARARIARLALAFCLLRPFDLLPTLWNRVLLWAVVRLRTRRAALRTVQPAVRARRAT